ncbi:hypothetical protein KIN20_014126 [Parelaphostrongylus tenuis]|uniref:Uncharacterized protein n=1 Tax=Parelaphostrongylus tenuis TaxID=148309 RepID=A0AAD5MD56_PARTN|nr:hypothetical protein KIN20_014126 [Parelaphostrongylus tenuis]
MNGKVGTLVLCKLLIGVFKEVFALLYMRTHVLQKRILHSSLTICYLIDCMNFENFKAGKTRSSFTFLESCLLAIRQGDGRGRGRDRGVARRDEGYFVTQLGIFLRLTEAPEKTTD